jgi:hypothetical protein
MFLKWVLENPKAFDEVNIRLFLLNQVFINIWPDRPLEGGFRVGFVFQFRYNGGIRTAGAMVLHFTYDYKIREQGNDPLVDLADKVNCPLRQVDDPSLPRFAGAR